MPYAPDLAGHALDGRYELHEMIGEGTFGRVYRGYDRRLAREVAIKVIKPWWAEDPDWIESFEREAQLLARVSGPGIVQIYDVGQADEGLYYVTELVDGESLADRLRRGGRLAPWQACDLAEQLCRALEQAHDEQIVHRDIKPANVLISSRGRVKVGDLGIARLAEGTPDGSTATIVGTPRYMAPEQASGQLVSPATDVYSAGVVLFEMLAGHPPFNGETAVEIALRHVQQPVPALPAGTPRSLERVVKRALAKEPEARYQTAADMADALAQARASVQERPRSRSRGGGVSGETGGRSGQPTWVAPRYSPRRNVNPGARRRTIAAFAVALVVLAALAVAAVALRARATVALPQLHGLTRGAAISKLNRAHLKAVFSTGYDDRGKPGTVVRQTPGAGARLKEGSAIELVLSKGPRPVTVPRLTGQESAGAVAHLHRIRLDAKLVRVPAPGTTPGLVTAESPTAGRALRPHSTVTLSVAETPSWRNVTSFNGDAGGHSVWFRIRGTQWRIVYRMSYDGTCNFVFFCNGPSAQVLGSRSTSAPFDLSDGGTQTRVLKTGPGVYQVMVKPGWDSATWSLQVEDWL